MTMRVLEARGRRLVEHRADASKPARRNASSVDESLRAERVRGNRDRSAQAASFDRLRDERFVNRVAHVVEKSREQDLPSVNDRVADAHRVGTRASRARERA